MYNILLLTSRKEKEKEVIKLAEKGKTTREIVKEVHISLKDIGNIIRKATGDTEGPTERRRERRRDLNG